MNRRVLSALGVVCLERVCLLAAVLLASPASPLLAWQFTASGSGTDDDRALSIALDPSGNVLAAGYFTLETRSTSFTVVKLSGPTGLELWRRDIQGSATQKRAFSDAAFSVAVDPAGDVIAVGVTENMETDYDFTVVKLAGKDGTELWRNHIHGSDPNYPAFGSLVAVLPSGDVLAAGFIGNLGASADFFVTKLSGRDGSELWRKTINGASSLEDYAFALSVDSRGDVAAGGETWHFRRDLGYHPDYLIVKLSGDNGEEIWRTSAELGNIGALTVDPDDNIFAGGYGASETNNSLTIKMVGRTGATSWLNTDPAFGSGISSMAVDRLADVVAAGTEWKSGMLGIEGVVQKLSGTDGSEIWSQPLSGSGIGYEFLSALLLDKSQDPLVAGTTVNSDTGYDFTVAKMLGQDGRLLWRRSFGGSGDPTSPDAISEGAAALGLDSEDNVAAGGYFFNEETGIDFTVVKLCGSTGEDFPPDILSFLREEADYLEGTAIQRGLREGLLRRLQIMRRLLEADAKGNRLAVANVLGAFARLAETQRGRGIPDLISDQLLGFASRLQSLIPTAGKPSCKASPARTRVASSTHGRHSSVSIPMLRAMGLVPAPVGISGPQQRFYRPRSHP